MANDEPRVKGVSFRTIDACYEELRGVAARDRARDLMVPELRDLFRSNLVLAATWYPISWYRSALAAYRASGHDGLELVRQIGYQAVKRDMRSLHKLLFAKIVSPQTLLGVAARLFSGYYDTGSFKVVDSARGYVWVRLEGCIGFDQNMWTELYASCMCYLELAGAREIRGRIKSGGREHDTATELEAHWLQ